MPAPSGNRHVTGSLSSRVRELGLVLPAPPTPLGAYVESSEAANFLFLSGMLPVVDRKLAISGRLGETNLPRGIPGRGPVLGRRGRRPMVGGVGPRRLRHSRNQGDGQADDQAKSKPPHGQASLW